MNPTSRRIAGASIVAVLAAVLACSGDSGQ
jgi:hypothetical protein